MIDKLFKKPNKPTVHQGMPHTQIGITPPDGIMQKLADYCFSLPNVSEQPTQISVPGARALWLDESVHAVHPETMLVGREFAHIHPDASLHLPLPELTALQAIENDWAEPHPVAKHIGLPGMVLLYTPMDKTELEVVRNFILESYQFVTGLEI